MPAKPDPTGNKLVRLMQWKLTATQVLIASITVLALCVGLMYMQGSDISRVKGKLDEQRNRLQTAARVRDALSVNTRHVAPPVGRKWAAVVALWPITQDGVTTATNGCIVSRGGTVLTVAHAVDSTGSKFRVHLQYNATDSLLTTYTVRWKDPARDLALLTCDEYLTGTVACLDLATSMSRRGDAVAIASLIRWSSELMDGGSSDAKHFRLTSTKLEYESWLAMERHMIVAAEIGSPFLLLDGSTEVERFGSPVLDGEQRLIGLVFAVHRAGEYFGEPSSLVTCVDPRVRAALAELEADR